VLLLGGAIFVVALASSWVTEASHAAASLWLPNAIALPVLARSRRERWPALAAGTAAAIALADLALGRSLAVCVGAAAACLVEIVAGAAMLRRLGPGKARPISLADLVGVLAVACLAAPALGAGAGALVNLATAPGAWTDALLDRWLGDVLGAALLALPGFLVTREDLRALADRRALLEVSAAVLLTTTVGLLAVRFVPSPVTYAAIPLGAVALRGGLLRVALVANLSLPLVAAGLVVGPWGASWASANLAPRGLLVAAVVSVVFAMIIGATTDLLRAGTRRMALTVLDHIPAMVGYWRSDLTNRFANSAYLDWFGLEPEDIRDRHIRDVIGEDRFRLNLPYIEAALRGEPQVFEREIVDPKGNKRSSMASYVPAWEGGEITGFFAFVSDITPLKQAERSRTEAQTRLQSVIDAAIEFSIIATDLEGNVHLFSAGAERLLGYRREDVVGKRSPSVFHDAAEVAARGEELSGELGYPVVGFDVFVARARRGESESREWTYIRQDGARIPVQLVVTPTRSGDGGIDGFLGVAKDITLEKSARDAMESAREQAELSSRFKSEFVANMSHELRTPMNAVLGMTHLLGSTQLSGAQRKYLEMIRNSGQSLLGIVNDILDFSKIEAGRMELSSVAFDLDEICSAVGAIMAINAGEKELELVIDVAQEVPRDLIGDPQRLQQILVNLMGNAVKFTEHGEVVLAIELAERNVAQGTLRFSVRDTGIGMTEAQLQRIYTAFSQADASTSRRFGGTGLGLVITRRLVDLMGGTLEVSSEPGRGSEFSVTLPMKLAEHVGAARPPTPGGLRFLVVDDNGRSRSALRNLIERWGYEVEVASSGAEALGRIAARSSDSPYDVTLVDWPLPGEDGLQTLRAIRRSQPGPRTRLLLMGGAMDRRALAEASDSSGADELLTKPISASTLFDAVAESLRRKEAGTLGSRAMRRSRASARKLEGRRLLLVEDNSLNQLVARGLLEEAGARVEIAGGGAEAIELLRAEPGRCDAILMDVQMPGLDGYETTRILRGELGLTLPIIATTAGVLYSERERCTAAGMSEFIPKPIEVSQMLSVISRLLPAAAEGAPVADTRSSDDGVFAVEGFFAFIEVDPEARASFIGAVQEFVDRGLAPLDLARRELAEGRVGDAARSLHTLRGSIGSIGARRFAEAAARLEAAIRGDHAGPLAALWAEVEGELCATLEAASRWLERQNSARSQAPS
jgi:two-component system, sensor histidine kinase and response regulator